MQKLVPPPARVGRPDSLRRAHSVSTAASGNALTVPDASLPLARDAPPVSLTTGVSGQAPVAAKTAHHLGSASTLEGDPEIGAAVGESDDDLELVDAVEV